MAGAQGTIIVPSTSNGGSGIDAAQLRSLGFYQIYEPGKKYDQSNRLSCNFISSGTHPSNTSEAELVPMVIGPEAINFDQVEIEVTSARSGSSAIMAVYQGDGDYNYPKTKLQYLGIIDTTTTGVKTLVVDDTINFTGLIYWFYACNDGSVSVTVFDDINSTGDVGVNPTFGVSGVDSGFRQHKMRATFALNSPGSEQEPPDDIESILSGPSGADMLRIAARVA